MNIYDFFITQTSAQIAKSILNAVGPENWFGVKSIPENKKEFLKVLNIDDDPRVGSICYYGGRNKKLWVSIHNIDIPGVELKPSFSLDFSITGIGYKKFNLRLNKISDFSDSLSNSQTLKKLDNGYKSITIGAYHSGADYSFHKSTFDDPDKDHEADFIYESTIPVETYINKMIKKYQVYWKYVMFIGTSMLSGEYDKTVKLYNFSSSAIGIDFPGFTLGASIMMFVKDHIGVDLSLEDMLALSCYWSNNGRYLYEHNSNVDLRFNVINQAMSYYNPDSERDLESTDLNADDIADMIKLAKNMYKFPSNGSDRDEFMETYTKAVDEFDKRIKELKATIGKEFNIKEDLLPDADILWKEWSGTIPSDWKQNNL